MGGLKPVRVWDLPVRLGHWLLAGGFILAWLTGDSEEWRLIHVYAGSAAMAVALFRVGWGFIGSHHARFSSFVRGPAAALAYLKSLGSLSPRHYTGHNPAGGLAILGLLALAIATGASGWLAYQELYGDWVASLHESLFHLLLALVALHLAGVAAGSLAHGENLVRAMITGRKQGAAADDIRHFRPLAAVVLLVWVVAASWWLAQ